MSSRREHLRAICAAGAGLSLVGGCSTRRPLTKMTDTQLEGVKHVLNAREKHWVGDGFHVTTVFGPHILDPQLLSPFILMDYASPRSFSPTQRRRGVGQHPHRGFETVTLAIQGELSHRDSSGGGGNIYAGDVQWMTAGAGIVHEEFHSSSFSRSGGVLEMIQLWVNLPRDKKMSAPRYQAIRANDIPQSRTDSTFTRVIAGEFDGVSGPAETQSSLSVLDLAFLRAETRVLHFSPLSTTIVFCLRGKIMLQGERWIDEGNGALMTPSMSGALRVTASDSARVMVLNGEPLNEPVVAHGPFVMNEKAEIEQAILDYRSGRMGGIS